MWVGLSQPTASAPASACGWPAARLQRRPAPAGGPARSRQSHPGGRAPGGCRWRRCGAPAGPGQQGAARSGEGRRGAPGVLLGRVYACGSGSSSSSPSLPPRRTRLLLNRRSSRFSSPLRPCRLVPSRVSSPAPAPPPVPPLLLRPPSSGCVPSSASPPRLPQRVAARACQQVDQHCPITADHCLGPSAAKQQPGCSPAAVGLSFLCIRWTAACSRHSHAC